MQDVIWAPHRPLVREVAPFTPPGTDHDTNTSGTFADVNLEMRRPDRPVPPMAGTAAVGGVVHLLATAIEEGRGLSSMSGILADTSYRLLPA
jgi:hypothetical protein